MLDIHIHKKPTIAKVYKDDTIVKEQDLTPEDYKEYMVELSGDRIGAIRLANKLFKPTWFKFKGVKI